MDRIIHKLIAVVVISVVVYPVAVIPVVASIMLFYAGVQLIRKLDRRTGGRPFRHRGLKHAVSRLRTMQPGLSRQALIAATAGDGGF
jgi:uncharacterized membrane protein